jgi:hypothetical protein
MLQKKKIAKIVNSADYEPTLDVVNMSKQDVACWSWGWSWSL